MGWVGLGGEGSGGLKKYKNILGIHNMYDKVHVF